ncbi:MAG TPA: TadE/TadG family type IV pilus assembly protein [Candidatus Eisenbacteria bacterium]|nr:TadE/TadG family type IV pilus assembly protein [Candidatus Eisenbacteria bacterium]
MNARRRMHEHRGQTLVEVAVALPVLLLVLFAILQFGIVFKNYLALTDAVRAGARKGAVSRQVADPVGTTKTAVRNAATDLGPSLTVTVTPAAPWVAGNDLTVKATYPFCIDVLHLVVRCGNLTSQTVEHIE